MNGRRGAYDDREWTHARKRRVLELLCGTEGTGVFVGHSGEVEVRGVVGVERSGEAAPVRLAAVTR